MSTTPRSTRAARALLVAAVAASAGASAAAWPPAWIGVGPVAALAVLARWRPLALGLLLGFVVGSRAMVSPPVPVASVALPRATAQVLTGSVRSADPPGPRGTRLTLDLLALGETPQPRDAGTRGVAGGVSVLLGPGPTPVLAPGDLVRFPAQVDRFPAARNPGAIDVAARWARLGISLRAHAKDPSGVEVLRAADGPAALVARARAEAAFALQGSMAPEDAGLARAMVLGDRGALTEPDRIRFRDSGQAHVVAVSGLHVTLLLAAFLGLLARLGVPDRFGAVAGIILIAAYVPFAGAAPSAVRAGVGGVLYLAARLLHREASGLGVLAAVTLGILATDPAVFYDVGFQLSFAAVVGILLLGARLEAAFVPEGLRIPGVVEPPRCPVRRTFAISLGAWFATAPLLLGHLGQICPAGALVAVPVVPLGAALLATGFGAVLLAPLPGLGPAAGAAFTVTSDATRALLDVVVDLGVGSRALEPPDAGWHAAYLAAFLAACLGPGRSLALGTLAQTVLLGLAMLPRAYVPPEHPRLVVLDVGRGQCVILLLPDGRAACLDAGSQGDPDVGVRTIVPALRALRVRTLSCVVLSHPDGDHTGGLPALARAFPCDRVVVGPAFGDDAVAALKARGLTVARGGAGDVLLEGAWGTVRVLAPAHDLLARTLATGGAPPSDNDASLVLEIASASGGRVLLPGDVEERGVAALLATHPGLAADVLLLPHHGLPGPGRDRLLAALSPAARVASCARTDRATLPIGTISTAASGAVVVDLLPGGARISTPWAGNANGPGYHPPTVALPVAALPDAPALWIVPLALLLFAWAAARPLGWLTPSGSALAFVLGVGGWLAFGGGGLAALFAPFLVATLLGKLPGGPAHPARGARQVAANGIPAFAGVLVALLGRPDLGLALYLGALACLGADTCATEIGTRYGGTPRSVLGGRSIARGESGGVTPAGLAASVGGSLLAPLAYLVFAGMDAGILGAIAGAGVLGALLDSVLGATLQFRGRHRATGRRTESVRIDGVPTERTSGLRWLDNDGVNLASGLAAAIAALGLLALRSLR